MWVTIVGARASGRHVCLCQHPGGFQPVRVGQDSYSREIWIHELFSTGWREEPRAMQWPWPEDVPAERRPAIAQILRDAGYGPRSKIEFVYMRVPAGCAQVLTPVSVCWCFWSI